MQFDRLILLHEGYQVYQGPVSEIQPYLASMGISMGKFMNPADFVLKLTQAPQLVKPGLRISHLYGNYESVLRPNIDRE